MTVHELEKIEFQTAYGVDCAALTPVNERRGLYPTICRVPVSGRTLRHSHFESEVFIIIEGKGRMGIESESREVAPGNLIRIPPFSAHELMNTGESELVFVSVYSEDSEFPAPPPRVVVTAAPPTPNGPLHLGHISGPYLASDILARYLRLRSSHVRTHCGTDDHQNYVAERARAQGRDPEDFRRVMRGRIADGLQHLRISFDDWIEPKTNTDYQTRILHFADAAMKKGVIERERLGLPYCSHCEEILIDAKVKGRCPVCSEESHGGCEACGLVVPPQELLDAACSRCGQPAARKEVEVYTFDLYRHLPAIRSELAALNLSPRHHRLLEIIERRGELKVLVSHSAPLSTENEALRFGEQSLHVWFEMAAHYESFATGAETWIHCFGFDNGFHYLFFIPALLRAMNTRARLPDSIVTNEFLLLEGSKFSTSRGHAIWADEFVTHTDSLRLFLSFERPSKRQTDFSTSAFHAFAKDLEPRLRQVRELALRQEATTGKRETELLECNRFTREMEHHFSPDSFDPRQAARRLLAFLDQTLHEGGGRLRLRALALAMLPLMPEEARTLLEALKVDEAWITDWARAL